MKDLAPITSLAAFVAAARSTLDALEHVPLVVQPADEVRPIAALAQEWGLEAKALVREAKRAGIAKKLGRELVAKRSAVVALVDGLDCAANRALLRVDDDDPRAALAFAGKRSRSRRLP